MSAITFLPTPDLAETHRFYTEVLGLEMVLDQGACRVYRASGEAYWGFCTHLDPMPQPERVILTLVVDDVPGFHAKIVERGGAPDGPPRVNERFRIEHFFLVDPAGYRVEVQRFLHPFP